jgi:hypothetical protein
MDKKTKDIIKSAVKRDVKSEFALEFGQLKNQITQIQHSFSQFQNSMYQQQAEQQNQQQLQQ